MPRSRDLPEDLKALVRRNALQLSHNSFRTDSERLASAVERALEKSAAQNREREKKERLEAERRERDEKERFAALRRESEEKERRRLNVASVRRKSTLQSSVSATKRNDLKLSVGSVRLQRST